MAGDFFNEYTIDGNVHLITDVGPCQKRMRLVVIKTWTIDIRGSMHIPAVF